MFRDIVIASVYTILCSFVLVKNTKLNLVLPAITL